MPNGLSWPSGARRLHPAEFIPSSHIRDPSAGQDDGLTDTTLSRPQFLPARTRTAPSTYEHSGQEWKLAKPDCHFHPSVEASTVDERRATVGEGDEGAEEIIPVSGNAKRRSSSPPQQILNNPALLQEIWAMHCSRRAMALQELQARYAPAAQTGNTVTPTAPQSDKYDNLSYNHVQQSKMPNPTYNEENTINPPHYPGKLSTPSASQESFDNRWLDDIDHVIGPDGKLMVHDPGSGSS
ncbi:hypothetical protein ACHAO7_010131 [Fusarium culmorum]